MTKHAAAVRRRALTTGLVALLVACGGAPEGAPNADGADQLVVERLEEADGTTVVRNLSGSKWGGNATLRVQIEIGVDEGDERYMFNKPRAYWATDTEIFVLEPDDGKVRVYGFDGIHRRDFGRPGQGPGELENAISLVVLLDGRVAITNSPRGSARTSLFSQEGEFLEEWRPGDTTPGEGMFVVPFMAAPTAGGIMLSIFARNFQDPDAWQMRAGFTTLGPSGYSDDPWVAPEITEKPAMYEVQVAGRTLEQPVPFAIAQPSIAVTPEGYPVWSHGDTYRFHIVRPEGVLAVERVAERYPIHPGEVELMRDLLVTRLRRQMPDFDWDGSGIPEYKAWIQGFVIDQAGTIWVARSGPTRDLDPCVEIDSPGVDEPLERCWEERSIVDVFDASTGEYLGAIDQIDEAGDPVGVGFGFVRDDLIVTGFQDEFGVNKVRVMRIVKPGDQEETVP